MKPSLVRVRTHLEPLLLFSDSSVFSVIYAGKMWTYMGTYETTSLPDPPDPLAPDPLAQQAPVHMPCQTSSGVLYLNLCIDRWRRLSYLFLLFFGTLHSDAFIFPFLLCILLLFFSQLFVRPPQTAILLLFSMGMVLIPASCTMSQTSFHSSSGTPSIRSRPLNLFLTSTV